MRKHITMVITTMCFVIGLYTGDKLVTNRRK